VVATWSSWSFIARQVTRDANWSNWRITLSNVDGYIRQLVGIFGWLDTWVSEATLSMWFLTAGALVAITVMNRLSPSRQGIILLLACLAMPLLFGFFRDIYFQTRYVLPALIVAFVLFVVNGVRDLTPTRAWLRARLLISAGCFITHLTAFLTNMHRYSHGQTQRWRLFTAPAWEPPHIGNLGALLLVVAGSLGFSCLAARRVGQPAAVSDGAETKRR